MKTDNENDDCVAEFFLLLDDGRKIGRAGWIAAAAIVLVIAVCVFAS